MSRKNSKPRAREELDKRMYHEQRTDKKITKSSLPLFVNMYIFKVRTNIRE